MTTENEEVSDPNKKDEGGRPPYEPNDYDKNKVKALAAVGIPQIDIARVLRISVNTLRKYFTDELEISSIEANGMVGGKLYSKVMAGDTTAMIWWTKARMGWSEKKQFEHSGEIGGSDYIKRLQAAATETDEIEPKPQPE